MSNGSRLMETPCLRDASDHVVLDLSGVNFLDSSGVRYMLKVVRGFFAARKKIVLVNPNPLVLKTLQLVNFDHLVPIASSVEEAIGTLPN